jgi:IclR family acetate operon transcriptional repressor
MASSSVRRRVSANGDLGQQLTQSLDRALMILGTFSSLQPEAGVQELAVKLALTPSTVSRLLATLERRGYVEQDRRTGRFRLGLSALELGYHYVATSELIARAMPQMCTLAQHLGLDVYLYGLDRGQMVRYANIFNPPRLAQSPGVRFHPHTSASGKLLLAYLDAEALERVLATIELRPVTPRSITTLVALREDLEAIRQRGYGTDNEESRLGNACLAVPVRAAAGTVVAALSVGGPVRRFAEEHRAEILEHLFDRGHQLSQAMGYVASQVV